MKEGIIKFGISRWDMIPELEAGLWKDLERYRKVFYDKTLIGYDREAGLGYGNISRRLQGDSFVITGSQTGNIADLDGRHYTVVKSADFTRNSVECEGPIEPSSESITHAVFYYHDQRINAVLHFHSRRIWEKYIKDPYAVSTPETAEYGSSELKASLENILENERDLDPLVIAMRGHECGMIIASSDLEGLVKFIGTEGL